MALDLDPQNVDEIRRRVVEPVVRSLIRPDELEDILIEIRPDGPPQSEVPSILTVAVKASGEWISPPTGWGVGDFLLDADYFAADLYDRLRDELTESRLAWGELRDGKFHVLPLL
ncbi:hypothetical protein [Geodermatophilus sp. URMC 63]